MFSRKDKPKLVEDVNVGDSRAESPRHSAKGIYGLKKCHDATDAVADIVFVHGLTGNRETTWTDKSTGVFWPAHLLKADVPKTRIVTFGYDADITHFWVTTSQNCIRNHALNLANALAQLRERTETEERPIVFVAHSLGGLVFEDTMLASRNSPEPHLQKIYDSTTGVCFLGTPHCGSTLANWATVFSQIAGTVKKINNDLLRVLEPESEVLARIQADFHAMIRSRPDQGRPALAITCFFEELPVKGVGEIVPKHSAILPAYNSIGIHANHIDMARFSDAEDKGYLSISTEILRWVRKIQETHGVGASFQPAASSHNAASGQASSSPWWESTPEAQNPSPFIWADNTSPAQKPSTSHWTKAPAPFPQTSATPPFYSPIPGQFPDPPNFMQRYHPYYQATPDQMHPGHSGQSPLGWQHALPRPSLSPGPQNSQGGNVLSGVYNTGTIQQGTFNGKNL